MNRLVPEGGVIGQGVEGCGGRRKRVRVGGEQGVLVIVKIQGAIWWITERHYVSHSKNFYIKAKSPKKGHQVQVYYACFCCFFKKKRKNHMQDLQNTSDSEALTTSSHEAFF